MLVSVSIPADSTVAFVKTSVLDNNLQCTLISLSAKQKSLTKSYLMVSKMLTEIVIFFVTS